MTDLSHNVLGYRITLETFNGFFGAWLKRNLFTRQRLIITLVLAAVLMGASAVIGWQAFTQLVNQPNTPILLNALVIGLMVVVGFPLYFLMVAIPTYFLYPVLSYLWLAITFLIGPVRKRINNASLSGQGITKSYENHDHMTPWTAVYDLVETRKSQLIFTNRNCAMMIPKSGFATTDQADAFLVGCPELLATGTRRRDSRQLTTSKILAFLSCVPTRVNVSAR